MHLLNNGCTPLSLQTLAAIILQICSAKDIKQMWNSHASIRFTRPAANPTKSTRAHLKSVLCRKEKSSCTR